jgi:Fe-S oxidoreductase
VTKAALRIASQRRIPPFARHTFRHWYRHHRTPNPRGAPVVLWADTWNNYFLPATAQAAVRVLEAAGYQVAVPSEALCCGRPLYDYGMLRTAKTLLRRDVRALAPYLRDGAFVVGLEPSCVSVFRDELLDLLPNDPDAARLSERTLTLGEFLDTHASDFHPPRLARKAIVHGHCHDTSILGFDRQRAVFERLGVDYTILDSGCCGMAGAFGYEKGEHYRVSIACGERVLLPSVRKAAADTLIVADGFSCREQIQQTTQRRALHLAEVVALALDQEGQ